MNLYNSLETVFRRSHEVLHLDVEETLVIKGPCAMNQSLIILFFVLKNMLDINEKIWGSGHRLMEGEIISMITKWFLFLPYHVASLWTRLCVYNKGRVVACLSSLSPLIRSSESKHELQRLRSCNHLADLLQSPIKMCFLSDDTTTQ